MAEASDAVMTEIMNLLEGEPCSANGVITAVTAGRDIPALREQLAIVSTCKAKEAIGVQLTQEQVKRLDVKDVEKYYKMYKTYVGAKTTETVIENFLAQWQSQSQSDLVFESLHAF